MLFNSYLFILIFLPITLAGFYCIPYFAPKKIAIYWLISASLVFYGFWNPAYILLITVSILANFIIGNILASSNYPKNKKLFLILGIFFNLALITYYKYMNFFVKNVNDLLNLHMDVPDIILPLAISFFTFQQIAYLVDIYYKPSYKASFSNYALFVVFFPQLVAGPIVTHHAIIPQFQNKNFFSFSQRNLTIGLSIFLLGLFKKVVIADQSAIYANPIFQAAENGASLTIVESWFGSLAYTLQLYFDFSGYSDMAVGLGKLFNLNLPINFNSPYKANSIIEFWKRWHITLSEFLRNYLYIPLGGNRCGKLRRYLNIFITMLLGGLWHGANWTFVIWGAFHGSLIVINHLWHQLKFKLFKSTPSHESIKLAIFYRILTFIAVLLTWVVFRSESIQGMKQMFKAMFGFNGISLLQNLEPYFNTQSRALAYFNIHFDGIFHNINYDYKNGSIFIFSILMIALFAPNTMQFFTSHPDITGPVKPYMNNNLILFSTNRKWLLLMSLVGVISMLYVSKASEFLYFQF